jgi:ribonuclease R
MKSLSNDFYVHDEQAHALIGRRKKRIFRLGGEVTVTLKEADGLTGSTILELSAQSLRDGADIAGMEAPKGGSPERGAPAKFNKKSARKGPKSPSSDQKSGKPPQKKFKKKTTPKHKRKKKTDS